MHYAEYKTKTRDAGISHAVYYTSTFLYLHLNRHIDKHTHTHKVVRRKDVLHLSSKQDTHDVFQNTLHLTNQPTPHPTMNHRFLPSLCWGPLPFQTEFPQFSWGPGMALASSCCSFFSGHSSPEMVEKVRNDWWHFCSFNMT